MVERPISRQARMMRTAISPRLAMSTLTAHPRGGMSQRDVPVLLGGIAVAFRLQPGERRNQLAARLSRMDHFVDEPAGRGNVRVGELLPELGHPSRTERLRIRGCVARALIEE